MKADKCRLETGGGKGGCCLQRSEEREQRARENPRLRGLSLENIKFSEAAASAAAAAALNCATCFPKVEITLCCALLPALFSSFDSPDWFVRARSVGGVANSLN